LEQALYTTKNQPGATDQIKSYCDETLQWLDQNMDATKEAYEAKSQELLQMGFLQPATPAQSNSSEPKVEEVD